MEAKKKELIDKIKRAVADAGGLLMPLAFTVLGPVHSVEYIENCDSFNVNVIINADVLDAEVVTSPVDPEVLSEEDLEGILEAIVKE